MTHSHQTSPHDRILAVQPCTRGLGFAVITTCRELIDWGLKRARGLDANRQCLRAFDTLTERHRPGVVLLEDTSADGCVRSPRIVELLSEIRERSQCAVERISRMDLLRRYATDNKLASKQTLAQSVCHHYPELAPHLPPSRKDWQSEDQRLAFFGAVAMALHFLHYRSHTFEI